MEIKIDKTNHVAYAYAYAQVRTAQQWVRCSAYTYVADVLTCYAYALVRTTLKCKY